MPVTARAAVLDSMKSPTPYADSQPLKIRDIVLDDPKAGEVLVRIRAAGLCHSDLSVINGNRPRPMPMALGHEAAGIVQALGPDVTDLEIGDHVVMVFMPSCGHCTPCAEGRPALCEPGAVANGEGRLLSGRRAFVCEDGQTLNHHLGCSAFATHAVVSRHSLVKVDKDLPFEHAALFGCAVLTGVGAVVNTAQIKAGQSAVIIGLGGVGLAALLGAKAAGASPIVAVDLNEDKLALAGSFGAITVNAGAPDAVEQVRALTHGGADFAFEMAGSARALDAAWRMTRRGGTTITAGLPPPDATLAVNIVSLVAEERTLKGSYIGACVPSRDIPRYIRLFKDGRLPVDRLLSGTLTLDQINTAFDALADGMAVRQVIHL